MLTKFQAFQQHMIGVVGKPNNLFIPEATQRYPLGARFKYGPRTFHYAYGGGVALAAGKLVAGTDMPAEANVTVATTAAIGATEVPNITTTAAEINLDGGMMIVNDNEGEGNSYGIVKSKANAALATSTDVTLADPLAVALVAASSQVELYSSPYYDLDLSAAITDIIIGVPPVVVAIGYYFWVQTWGPAAVLAGATLVAGSLVSPHTTDGSVGPLITVTAETITENVVGYALTAGTATEYNAIFLRITP